MNQLSKEQHAQSRSIQTQILQSAAKQKQSVFALCIGVDATTISRWLDSSNSDSKLVHFAQILTLCDLKVVPSHVRCYDPQKIDILFKLAKDNFERSKVVDDFFYESLFI